MGEKPLAAVRKKPKSSIVVGLGLQKAGRSDAFVSAGNTGAMLAASTILLGLHDGVERATVATLFPTGSQPVLVLDGGANVDCSARELVGFAYLGTVYMRDVLRRPSPTVGLLNVGEEEEKGNAITREAHSSSSDARGSTTSATSRGATSSPGTTSTAWWTWWCATASWATWCSSSTNRWAVCSSAWSSSGCPTC